MNHMRVSLRVAPTGAFFLRPSMLPTTSVVGYDLPSLWDFGERRLAHLLLLPVCFLLRAASVVGARRAWQSRRIIPLGAVFFGLVFGRFVKCCILPLPSDNFLSLP